ncbi:hypothetical protein FOPE_02710 [Fonsecaea pedrosoi]|nr:hypothetical protein FOPE_02710 [Fonsecaea pedrosoi]
MWRRFRSFQGVEAASTGKTKRDRSTGQLFGSQTPESDFEISVAPLLEDGPVLPADTEDLQRPGVPWGISQLKKIGQGETARQLR